MSRVETHFGKFRVLARGNKAVFDYIERNNLGDKIKECGWADEIDFDTDDKNYIILHKDAKYGSDAEHILCEFIVHKEFDEGECVDILQKTDAEEYEFFTQFHNGGTCLEEVLSEELSKADKIAPVKSKIEEIEDMIKKNAEDFKNGIIDYEDLHNSQYILFKQLEELKAQL